MTLTFDFKNLEFHISILGNMWQFWSQGFALYCVHEFFPQNLFIVTLTLASDLKNQ